MKTELERRVAAAVRLIADEVPVTAPAAETLRPRISRPTDRATARWRMPVLTAAAVLILLAVLVVLPGLLGGRRAVPPGAPTVTPILPTRFASMSPLTATVTDSPPGPAIALYRQGSIGSRSLPTSQVLVLGADGSTYRQVDLVKRRGAEGADGEWHAADAMLSPDGTLLAVASPDGPADRIEVLNLKTGKTMEYALEPPVVVRLLDWSPDGRQLMVAVNSGLVDGSFVSGELALFDLSTGWLHRFVGVASDGWLGSFSPDGARFAVAHADSDSGPRSVTVVDLAGAARVELALPWGQSLAGRAAWSPDGRVLAVVDDSEADSRFVFIDPTGRGATVPSPVSVAGTGWLVGWRSPTTMFVDRPVTGGRELMEVPIDGGAPRTVSQVSNGLFGLAAASTPQLAEGLLAQAQIREVGDIDRGPWPVWWRVTVLVAVLLAALIGWRVATRSGRGRRRLSVGSPARPGKDRPLWSVRSRTRQRPERRRGRGPAAP